jgi:hypothetical protein
MPLPHTAFGEEGEHTEGTPVQPNPTSTWQVAEHPSPETVLPSSQPSFPSRTPSPQTILDMQACPAEAHV